jgi:hypothetical protein
MRLTKNAKRDTSEPGIVEALKAYGFSVLKLSVPYGPDLVIAKDRRVRVAEVKSGKKKLRQSQEDWWTRWAGNPRLVLTEDRDVEVLAAFWSDEALGDQVILHRQARARLAATGKG